MPDSVGQTRLDSLSKNNSFPSEEFHSKWWPSDKAILMLNWVFSYQIIALETSPLWWILVCPYQPSPWFSFLTELVLNKATFPPRRCFFNNTILQDGIKHRKRWLPKSWAHVTKIINMTVFLKTRVWGYCVILLESLRKMSQKFFLQQIAQQVNLSLF